MQAEVRAKVSWSELEAFVAQRPGGWPLVTYLDGTLELRFPTADGQRRRRYLASIVEEILDQRGITYDGCRSWLSTSAARFAAVEPDECYVLHDPKKPVPDLALHVDSDSVVDVLEASRRLGVGEVWRCVDDVLEIHVLTDSGYERRARSPSVPELDLALVRSMLALPTLSEVRKRMRAEVAVSSAGTR